MSQAKNETTGAPVASSALSDSYDPKQVEGFVRNKWSRMEIARAIQQNFDSKGRASKWGYVEGPPTLNGEPHMGHLRGRAIKDVWYRFETMRGNDIDFRGGWDCQGLPVELAAEKELGLSGTKAANLKAVGEEALVAACKSMLSKYHRAWRSVDEMLGLLINDEKAYWTYHDSYIEREWKILKSGWENNILSEGYRVTPYCPSCQTSLSATEVAGSYETLEDPSMYFKMRVRSPESNSKNAATFLIAWTTMPFTVVTDELVGAKPDSEYCFVRVPTRGGKGEATATDNPQRGDGKEDGETWIVGAERLESLMKELRIENYAVERRFSGRELEGTRYEYPLADLVPGQRRLDEESAAKEGVGSAGASQPPRTQIHSVVAEDFVDVTTGSGLVHMAPANGEDDFEVSQRRQIPVFNPVDDQAVFTQDAGAFAGLFVRDSDSKVADALRERGLLLRYGKIKHEYPVCWRSGHRLVWLCRREYFYFVDRLKDRAVDAGRKAEYYFEQPRNRFIEIIKEKRPWCVSRERVWGAPLPIWKCDNCGEKLGLFSRKEIVERAKSLPDGANFELHKPWIDKIEVDCPKCGRGVMHREPFVLDTWHNSGAAPYASLTDKEYAEYIPVPFLTEGIDQTRGWAYTLLIENVILTMKDQAPFQSFLFMGHVLDEKGEKLSKSKMNFVPVRELLTKYSSDLIRLYLMWKAGPIDSINFSIKEMATRPFQILNTLYHMHLFYEQNASFDGFRYTSADGDTLVDGSKNRLRKEDRWLLSRLESLVNACTTAYTQARYQEAARSLERFLIDDLSQTYVPLVRGELWEESAESEGRRRVIYAILGFTLLNCDRLLHPIAPFVTDYLAGRIFNVESLILEEWPEPRASFRNDRLEVEFDILSKMVSLTNAARMKAKVKRRWPLRNVVYLVSQDVKDLAEENKGLLLEQTNVLQAELETDPKKTPIVLSVKPNFQQVAPRAREKMSELASKLAASDARALYSSLSENAKARLPEMPDFEILPSDVEFTFSASDSRYSVAENYGIVVALDTSRDEELITQGIMRDAARNIQALRKERGFNPTDVLDHATVAGLGEDLALALRPKEGELAFLVRVRRIVLLPNVPAESTSWKSVELDSRQIKIDVG